jgi:hypothetical protein
VAKLDYWRGIVGEGPTAPMLLPLLTTAQCNAISGPMIGSLVWNTDTQTTQQYQGSSWVTFAPTLNNVPAGGVLAGNYPNPGFASNPSFTGTISASTIVASGSSTVLVNGGSTGIGFVASATPHFGVFFGLGTPTISAAQGSLFLSSSGAPWYNNNGSTGWTQIGTGSGGGGSSYPGPVPDMQTFLQAAATAGTFCDWIWGNYVATTPIVVSITTDTNNIGCDFHGAIITSNFSDNTKDIITYIIPGTSSGVEMAGFEIRNLSMFGNGGSGCNNCLTISSPSHANGIYGVHMQNVSCAAARNSGIQFYGSVFEADFYGVFCRDNVFAGVELRNPNESGGGVISSINIWGGDLRTNGYGLALTADVFYQEPAGVYVQGTNFIANQNSGIWANSGIEYVNACHFENNCDGGSPTSNGAIWITSGGYCNVLTCDIPSNNGKQTAGVVIVGGGGGYVIRDTYAFNENNYAGYPTAQYTGAGNIYTDSRAVPVSTYFSGTGFTIWVPTTQSFST